MKKPQRVANGKFSWPVFALAVVALISLAGKVLIEDKLATLATAKPILKPLEAGYQADSLKLYNLGFANLFADLIWVQLLQNAEHTKIPNDQVSWEFTQLDALTTLDPQFDRVYSYGAIYLSIFRQDKLGAKSLLEKWVKRRPFYWKSNYFLGHHLFFEMGEKELASKYLLKSSTLEGAPYYISSLGIRLLEESEGLRQALRMSCDVYPNLSNPLAKDRLQLRIKSILFALQSSLWTDSLKNFRKAQGHDPASSVDLIPYVNSKSREIASSSTTEDVDSELTEILRLRFGFHYSAAKRQIEPDRSAQALGLETIGVYRPREQTKS